MVFIVTSCQWDIILFLLFLIKLLECVRIMYTAYINMSQLTDNISTKIIGLRN